jgi:type I restriction enzyme S subunit
MRARPAQAARIRIPLPLLPEQRRIASILDKADSMRAKCRQSIVLLEQQGSAIFNEMYSPKNTYSTTNLLEVCSPKSGGTPSKQRDDFWDGDVPWFSPKDLKSLDLWDSIDHISENAVSETPLIRFPANTVVTVVRGMILAHSFPVSCLYVEATINQDMKALIPRYDMDPQFLAYSMRAQTSTALDGVSNAGHATKRIETDVLGAIRVPNVSLDFQREFGRRIELLQTCLRAVVEQLATLDELFASLQHRAFRGEL